MLTRPQEVTWNLNGDDKRFNEDHIILRKFCDGPVPKTHVRLGLQTSFARWKAITMHNRGFVQEIVSTHDRPNIPMYKDQLVSNLQNDQFTYYSCKAKYFGRYRDMYKISNAKDMQGGCLYLFKWVSDS